MRDPLQCIVPPGLLLSVIRDRGRPEEQWSAVLQTLLVDQSFRHRRAENAARRPALAAPTTLGAAAGQPQRLIYDQKNSWHETLGTLVRAEGQPVVADD